MSLLFTVEGTQYIRHRIDPADSSLDNLAQWSCAAWVYPTITTAKTERAEIFNKAHAKRFNSDASTNNINVKQNKVGSVIEYTANVLTLNDWNFVACAVDADQISPNQQAWLYWGDLNTMVTEASYSSETTGYVGALENDIVDEQQNTSGDLIVGNKPWRSPWDGNRGWGGRIAVVAFWSTNVSLGTLRAFQFASFPPSYTNLELYAHYHQPGKVLDLSGNGRHGETHLI